MKLNLSIRQMAVFFVTMMLCINVSLGQSSSDKNFKIRSYQSHVSAPKYFKSLDQLASQGSSAVGSLPDNLTVTPQGSAQYSIPIAVPPGTAGIAPALSIEYSSGQDDGLLGMGFGLNGLTAVTRVDSNKAQNGVIHGVDFSNQDKFALNGKQLVAIKGNYGSDNTEYRTYTDDQVKIISHGQQGTGPASFTVYSKNGQIASYGATADSQVKTGNGTVESWALNRIQDRSGNYMDIKYYKDETNGVSYPTEIDYTGNLNAKTNAYNSVKFIYADRPDKFIHYLAGSKTTLNKRLTDIKVYTGTKLIYDYKLAYFQSKNTSRSLLQSVTQCDASGTCLSPTTFTWQQNDKGWVEVPKYAPLSPFATGSSGGIDGGMRLVDLNGDGVDDIIKSYAQGSTPSRKAWVNNGSTWEETPKYAQATSFPSISFDGRDGGVRFIDLNGDGVLDMIRSYTLQDGGTSLKNAWFNTANGWVEHPEYVAPVAAFPTISWSGRDGGVRFVDINGDGLLDIVRSLHASNGADLKNVWLNKIGKGWDPHQEYIPKGFPIISINGVDNGVRFVDLNGNGLPDLVQNYNGESANINAWLDTGSGWERSNNYDPPLNMSFSGKNGCDVGGRIADVNGDGLPDFLKNDRGLTIATWINTGATGKKGGAWQENDAYKPPVRFTMAAGGLGVDNDNGVRIVDVNGDGLPDLIQNYSSNPQDDKAWLNTGSGWEPSKEYAPPIDASIVWGNGQDSHDAGVRIVDLTGNGLPDLVKSDRNLYKNAWLNKAKKLPDYLTGITNGLGAKTTIDYEPLSGTAVKVYTKEHDAAYPTEDIQLPMYVVYQTIENAAVSDKTVLNQLLQTDPQANQHITTYHYTGAKVSHLGWGFLGFHQITTTDNSTGISRTVTYSQNPAAHNVGQKLASETHLTNGTLVTSSQYVWALKIFGDGSVNKTYYFPYIQTAIQNSDSLAGKPINTKTIVTTMDNYDNPTQVVDSIKDLSNGDVFATDTKSTYLNDPNNWLIGQLTQSQVTASAPNTPYIRRTNSFSYDANGLLAQTIREPNDAQYTLTKTLQRDSFGNVIKTTLSAKDYNDRVTEKKYDANGQYIIQETNALGQAVLQQMDPRFGQPAQTTDLNGLVTTYKYDGFGRLMETDRSDGTKSIMNFQWCKGLSGAPSGAVYAEISYDADKNGKQISPQIIKYYDSLDRQIAQSQQGFGGKLIWNTTAYDNLGRVVKQSLPYFDGDTPYYETVKYDVLGRVIQSTDPNDAVTTIKYDGLKTTTTNALKQTQTTIKNVRDQVVETIDSEGNTLTHRYDAFDNLIATVGPLGHQSTIYYDLLGRKTMMSDPNSGTWKYTYDPFDEMTSITDANGQTTTMTYDLLGRMLTRTDAAGTSQWTYGSDLTQHNVGQLVTEKSVVAGIHGGKPSALQLIHAEKEGLTQCNRSYIYDDLARLIETDITVNDQNYTQKIEYDTNGRPSIVTDAGGLKTQYHYDSLGFVTDLTNADTGQKYWHLNAMDAANHITSVTHSNGLVTTKIYDPKTTLLTSINTAPSTSLQLQQQLLFGKTFKTIHKKPASTKSKIKPLKSPKLGDAVIQNVQYRYNALGNLTKRNNLAINKLEKFSYDDLNRLTSDVDEMDYTQSRIYSYNSLGNLMYKSDFGLYRYERKDNAGPHAVTSVANILGKTIATYKYDKNGNQVDAIINGQERKITYTPFNKPKQIGTTTTTTKFYYDANRSRFYREDNFGTTKRDITVYFGNYDLVVHQDGTKMSYEYKHYIGNNTLYVKTSDGKEATYELLKDRLGSVTAITDANGNVVKRFHYTPFGEQQTPVITAKNTKSFASIRFATPKMGDSYPITHQGFAGHETVEAFNLIHMNGRIYDPQLGRFLSADPYIQNPGDIQSYNRYSYCVNNPLSLTDPSGYSWKKIRKKVSKFFKKAGRAVKKAMLHRHIGPILQAAVCVAANFLPFGQFWVAPAYSALVAHLSGQGAKHVLKATAVMMAANLFHFHATHLLINSGISNVVALPLQAAVSGIRGGVYSGMQGAGFKNGFIMSASVEMVSLMTQNILTSMQVTKAMQGNGAAVVGSDNATFLEEGVDQVNKPSLIEKLKMKHEQFAEGSRNVLAGFFDGIFDDLKNIAGLNNGDPASRDSRIDASSKHYTTSHEIGRYTRLGLLMLWSAVALWNPAIGLEIDTAISMGAKQVEAHGNTKWNPLNYSDR